MKLIDFESYRENPSKLEGLEARLVKEKDGLPVELVNPDTGELTLCLEIPKGKFINHDTLQFKKVYNSALGTIKNFSTPALRVWCYVLHELGIKSDVVRIDVKTCKEFTGYTSDVPIYKGIVELLENKFLFRKVGSTTEYFINVNKYFNGNRT